MVEYETVNENLVFVVLTRGVLSLIKKKKAEEEVADWNKRSCCFSLFGNFRKCVNESYEIHLLAY